VGKHDEPAHIRLARTSDRFIEPREVGRHALGVFRVHALVPSQIVVAAGYVERDEHDLPGNPSQVFNVGAKASAIGLPRQPQCAAAEALIRGKE
jgi:hypothetical protein